MTKKADTSVTIDITQKQHELLSQANRAVREAQERQRIVIETIVAGHDVPSGASVERVNSDPPQIVLKVPEK